MTDEANFSASGEQADFTGQDRRAHVRSQPVHDYRVRRSLRVMPIADAEVINVSRGGVAIRTRVPVSVGERLSFSTSEHLPPVLAEVVGVEQQDEIYRVRCRCLLGAFEDTLPEQKWSAGA